MRKAINESQLLQAALIGVLALAVVLMLLLRMGGSSDPAAETPAPAATPTAASDPTADSPSPADSTGSGSAATPTDTGAATRSAPAGSAGASSTGASTTDFVAGPGLPEPVAAAYHQGKAIVLLIVNRAGIDDRKLEETSRQLSSRSDAALFVTRASSVSNYSRITQGVDLDRTPALVIVRPKSLTEGPLPTAVVSYGFRGSRSVEQALDNALYKGPSDLPYYPR